MTSFFPNTLESSVNYALALPAAAVKSTFLMITPISAVIGASGVALLAEASVAVESQTGIVIFGHTFEFWAILVSAIVALIGMGSSKYRNQKDAQIEKTLALALQRADQAEKMLAKKEKELDDYRAETHKRLEDAHANMIAFTLENEKLREKTDMTPILKFMETLVGQMDKNTGVLAQLVNKFPGLRDPESRDREIDRVSA